MPDGIEAKVMGNAAGAPAGASNVPPSPDAAPAPVAAPAAADRPLTPRARAQAYIEGKRAEADAKRLAALASSNTGGASTGSAAVDPVEAKVAAVRAKIEADRAKAAEAAKATEPTELDQLRSQITKAKLDPSMLRSEKGREYLGEWCVAHGVDPVELFDALADVGESVARGGKLTAEQRLEKLEAKEKAEDEAKAEAEAAATAKAQAAAVRKIFLGAVSEAKAEDGAQLYPLLAALDEDEQMERGIAAAVKLKSEGAPFADADAIAAQAELDLRKLGSKIAPKVSGQTTVGSTEPRTLSGSLGGETPEPAPFVPGPEGRKARMRAVLQRNPGLVKALRGTA